jgi:hypothetical protein
MIDIKNINNKLSDDTCLLIEEEYDPFYFDKVFYGSGRSKICGCIVETEDYIILEYADRPDWNDAFKIEFKVNNAFDTTSKQRGIRVVIENEGRYWRFTHKIDNSSPQLLFMNTDL